MNSANTQGLLVAEVWTGIRPVEHAMARFYQQADWLMNESGDMKRIEAVKFMIGKHTRLITCPARWNNRDATKVVPEALAAGVGLYGFTVPRTGGGIVPLDKFNTQDSRHAA